MSYLEQIAVAVDEGKAKEVSQLIQQELDGGTSAKEVMEKGLVVGMEKVGRKFKDGKAYLPEILIAARAAQAGLEVLKPAIARGGVKPKGKVVIGTIQGDLHDIGKNLVKLVLQGEGFQVIDLGVDVSPAKFQQAVISEKPDVLAISALLTTTMVNIPIVLQTLKRAELRERVKVIIGGAPVTARYTHEVGADGYGRDCFQAVELARRFVEG